MLAEEVMDPDGGLHHSGGSGGSREGAEGIQEGHRVCVRACVCVCVCVHAYVCNMCQGGDRHSGLREWHEQRPGVE